MKNVKSIIAASAAAVILLTGCGDTANEPALPISEDPVEFSKNMKLGWCLGNTLDATGRSGLDSETSWGQPYATKEQLQFIKDSGFTSVRIPVSWSNHVDGDNNIDAEWMNRVTEVVDYAVDAGLYIILNSHHDCDAYYPTEEHYAESEKYITDIWTQIAEHFKDYDERLVFESMNEPRLMGTDKEWWFADNDEEGVESIKVICRLNQKFVDIIRSSGGKNSERFLMVPSNAASPGNALNSAFSMPDDPANKLILSVHAYSPYNFAMNGKGTDQWDERQISELGFMEEIYNKFTKNGYGVCIGEFGATNKNNLEARCEWAADYTALAKKYGFSCFLWDNGGTKSGEENFGMINRRDLSVFYPELLEKLVAGME